MKFTGARSVGNITRNFQSLLPGLAYMHVCGVYIVSPINVTRLTHMYTIEP